MTSNFGGGGQTVPRLFNNLYHLNNLNYDNLGLLMNFRYLTFFKQKKHIFKFEPVFNKDTLESLDKGSKNILIKIIEELTKGKNNFNLSKKLDIIMDSGSGAIANHLILEKNFTKENLINFFKNLINEHSEYLSKNNVFSAIALDYSLKNTYKKKASEFDLINYKKIMNNLINDKNRQIELIKTSLSKNYTTKLYAPLHGNNEEDFLKNYLTVREVEEKENNKFYGFALGGLGKYPRLKNGYSLIAKIVKSIRNEKENRKIHILGSAAINHIPTLIAGGATSFDCHSPWRRAMDGGQSGSPYKILIPLVTSKLEFNLSINKPLQYIDLNNLNISKWFCDCSICNEFSIEDIKKMLNDRTVDIESYYRGLILLYLHAVFQHSYLLAKIERDGLEKFIFSIPSRYVYQKTKTSKFQYFKDYIKNEINLID